MELPPFPGPLRAVLSRLPQYPPTAGLAVMLNLWLGSVLNGKQLPPALDKVICISVRDTGLRLLFRMREDGVAACVRAEPDLTITANANEFLALALRHEDADTLFFSRRLLMEGDTELGLLVRNTLDALDLGQRKVHMPTPVAALKLLQLSLEDVLKPSRLSGNRAN